MPKIQNMMVYKDGPADRFGGFVHETQEQVYINCANCGKPQLVEFRYPEGHRPATFEWGWCYNCQKEIEMPSITAGSGPDEPTLGQVTYEIHELEKNVAFLLECSKTLHDRLVPVISHRQEEGLSKDRAELCPMASAIADQNDKLSNLGSAFTSLLHNLEI